MAAPRTLVAAGLAALLVGLLVNLPARVAYQWFAPQELQLGGLAGSAWNGTAAQGRAGDFYFTDLDWRFRPLGLLAGKAAFMLEARPPGGFLETRLEAGFAGNLRLDDLRAALPLATLPGMAGAGVEGELGLNLRSLVLEDGWPVAAEGSARLAGLVLRGLSRRPIGDFHAALRESGDGIEAALEDAAGMLDLAGTAILARARSYRVQGRVGPKPQATPEVVQQLRLLGSPDAQGRHEFRFEGSL